MAAREDTCGHQSPFLGIFFGLEGMGWEPPVTPPELSGEGKTPVLIRFVPYWVHLQPLSHFTPEWACLKSGGRTLDLT